MITCPYCRYTFPEKHYFATHVPCPEPAGDKETK